MASFSAYTKPINARKAAKCSKTKKEKEHVRTEDNAIKLGRKFWSKLSPGNWLLPQFFHEKEYLISCFWPALSSFPIWPALSFFTVTGSPFQPRPLPAVACANRIIGCESIDLMWLADATSHLWKMGKTRGRIKEQASTVHTCRDRSFCAWRWQVPSSPSRGTLETCLVV